MMPWVYVIYCQGLKLFVQKDLESFVRNTFFPKYGVSEFCQKWVFESCQNLKFWVLCNFKNWILSQLLVVNFWHNFTFQFCVYLIYLTLLQFVFWSFFTVWDFRLCHSSSFCAIWNLSQYFVCFLTIKGFSFVTICVLEICHNLTFWVLAHLSKKKRACALKPRATVNQYKRQSKLS